MKKAICVILLVAIAATLCGCGRKPGEGFTPSGRFEIVSGENPNTPYYETIITDNETGVLYLVIYAYNHCGITPLLDTDGKPLLVREESET